MKTVHETLPKLKLDLDIPKFLVIVITVMTFFVVPAVVINYFTYNSQSQSSSNQVSGQVAGLSTTVNASTTNGIDLNSQAGTLVVGGTILIGISLILIIFLMADSLKAKQSKRYE